MRKVYLVKRVVYMSCEIEAEDKDEAMEIVNDLSEDDFYFDTDEVELEEITEE